MKNTQAPADDLNEIGLDVKIQKLRICLDFVTRVQGEVTN